MLGFKLSARAKIVRTSTLVHLPMIRFDSTFVLNFGTYCSYFAPLPERGRPRALSSCSWDWALPFQYFFCIHRYTNRNGAFPRISFIIFSLWTFRNISLYYLSCLMSICRLMNVQKLEIRRGDKEQWKPTSTAWIFFFLSREFFYIHSEKFLTIFFYAVFVFPE